MFEIIISNFGFWVNLLIPIMIGVYLFFRKQNREFTIQELGAQCGFTVVFVGCVNGKSHKSSTDSSPIVVGNLNFCLLAFSNIFYPF